MKLKIVNCKLKIEGGFTLVELLIVITILGILASIALVAFRSAQTRGRDAQRKSDLKQMNSALELFYADYQKYPNAVGVAPAACPYTPPNTWAACSWGTGEFTDGKTVYFKVLPKDPVSTAAYLYRVDATNQKFQLFAHLENTQDPQLITTTQVCGGTTPCNFAITSPNTTPTDF